MIRMLKCFASVIFCFFVFFLLLDFCLTHLFEACYTWGFAYMGVPQKRWMVSLSQNPSKKMDHNWRFFGLPPWKLPHIFWYPTGWWFGCHQFYFPINIGLLIIPIDSYFSGRGFSPTTNQPKTGSQTPTRMKSASPEARNLREKKGRFFSTITIWTVLKGEVFSNKHLEFGWF